MLILTLSLTRTLNPPSKLNALAVLSYKFALLPSAGFPLLSFGSNHIPVNPTEINGKNTSLIEILYVAASPAEKTLVLKTGDILR